MATNFLALPASATTVVSGLAGGAPRPLDPAAQQTAAPQPAAKPVKRRPNFFEVVGRIGDVMALMGDQAPLYQYFNEKEAERQRREQEAERQRQQQEQLQRFIQNPQDASAFRNFLASGISPQEALMYRNALAEPEDEPLVVSANQRVFKRLPDGSVKEIIPALPSEGSRAAQVQVAELLRDPVIAEERRRNPSLDRYLRRIENPGAMTDYQARRVGLDLMRVQNDVAKRREAARASQPKSNLAPTQRGLVVQKLRTMPVVRKQLDEVIRLNNLMRKQGTFARGPIAGAIPSQFAGGTAERFDKAVSALRKSILGMTRIPGVGSMSDYETRLDEAVLPSRWGFDEGREQAIENLKVLVDNYERGYRAMLNDDGANYYTPVAGASGQTRQVLPATPRGRVSGAPRSRAVSPDVLQRAREEAARRGLR